MKAASIAGMLSMAREILAVGKGHSLFLGGGFVDRSLKG